MILQRDEDRRGLLELHRRMLADCRVCAGVVPPPVTCRPAIVPRVLLVGQAPGPREVELQRPFAYTAGQRLFAWFARLGVSEEEFRDKVYMGAVIRCFPGRAPQGGDRVPSPEEIHNCAPHLVRELELLRPTTVIAVGQLAIAWFLPEAAPLSERVGEAFRVSREGLSFEVFPLPHPSGRSTWLNKPENRRRLERSLGLIAASEGWRETFGSR